MSTVAEIEAAIERLRPEEFAKLEAWLDERRAQRVTVQERNVAAAMDKVFAHHAPLLKKLSQ
ncbi:MAG: hypothetical protein KF712_20025 [Akkermansiaceae bacterium]|nr:hypothetical protein [Akkermansiaceae bacterium]